MFSSIASLQQEFISSRFSLNSLHTILLDCMQNTSSTFGFIAEVFENQHFPSTSLENIIVLSALMISSTGKTHLLIKEEYPISLLQDTIFTSSNLENFIFNNENGSTLTNIGFPPSFPVISNYVIKPLKFNKKLHGILLLANSSHLYNQEICDAIKPLTTTVETIFAGFRIMKNEYIISTIFNEIIVTSFTLRGKQFFENITNSITTKLFIDSCSIFKKVGNNFQMVASNLRGNANTFQVTHILNDYLLQVSNTKKLPERNNIPNSLLQDDFVNSCGFEYSISTNVLNENGETIGIICLLNRKVFQNTESILSTLSVLSTKISLELESNKN